MRRDATHLEMPPIQMPLLCGPGEYAYAWRGKLWLEPGDCELCGFRTEVFIVRKGGHTYFEAVAVPSWYEMSEDCARKGAGAAVEGVAQLDGWEEVT